MLKISFKIIKMHPNSFNIMKNASECIQNHENASKCIQNHEQLIVFDFLFFHVDPLSRFGFFTFHLFEFGYFGFHFHFLFHFLFRTRHNLRTVDRIRRQHPVVAPDSGAVAAPAPPVSPAARLATGQSDTYRPTKRTSARTPPARRPGSASDRPPAAGE